MIEHSVRFYPAYDDMINECEHETKGDHGRASVRVNFIAQDDSRAAVLSTSTGWYLPETYDGKDIYGQPLIWNKEGAKRWSSAAIDIHSPEPQFEDHPVSNENCPFTGGDCYSDTGFSAADVVLQILVRQGEDEFWKALEKWIPGHE